MNKQTNYQQLKDIALGKSLDNTIYPRTVLTAVRQLLKSGKAKTEWMSSECHRKLHCTNLVSKILTRIGITHKVVVEREREHVIVTSYTFLREMRLNQY